MTVQAVATPNIMKYYVTEDCLAPGTGTSGSAGIDVRSAADHTLEHGDRPNISTGLYIEIPEGHFGMLVPRSSTGRKGLRLANTVGIIDSDYRGEITVAAVIDNPNGMEISKGDRIAQILVVPYTKVALTQVEELNELEKTERGGAGFGSTGVK